MPKHGACCLSSLNLSEYVLNPYTSEAQFDFYEFSKGVEEGIKYLDHLIDINYNRHPLKEQQEMSYNYRNVGLGCFGYATMLMKLGITYGSKEAISLTDKIFHAMFKRAVYTSSELASSLGSYPKYNEKVWDSDIIKSHFEEYQIEALKKQGLRNCSLLSIAPNGSIATLLNESGGVEPEYAISYTRRTVGMTDNEDSYYTVNCKALKEYLEKYPEKKDNIPEYFIGSANIHWRNRVKTQAIMQKHIDTAISSTVNLPQTATKEDIIGIYLESWEKGLKGITIFRDGCKRLGILTTDNSTNQNNNEIENNSIIPRGAILNCSDDLIGKKRKLQTGCGSLHVLAYFDPVNGELQEVYFNKGSTGGCQNFMIGLSRTVSLLCRAGVDVFTIKDQLDSTGSCPSYAVRSATHHDTSKGSCCPMAIGNALIDMYNEMQSDLNYSDEENESIINENISSAMKCPECGDNLIQEGGCIICKSCGWSKCN